MKQIKLNIKKVDFRKSSKRFGDCLNCLLATAAKRQFKANKVVEGVYYILIDDIRYSHRSFGETEFLKRMENKEPFTIILKP